MTPDTAMNFNKDARSRESKKEQKESVALSLVFNYTVSHKKHTKIVLVISSTKIN